MQTLNWLDSHIGTIEEAKELINRFCWNLRIIEANGRWHVTTGGDKEKTPIFTADSREAVDSFIYGMALAYAGIPEHLFKSLENDIQEWIKSL
jgi:hypothetical protein